jgi:hypothetical protein
VTTVIILINVHYPFANDEYCKFYIEKGLDYSLDDVMQVQCKSSDNSLLVTLSFRLVEFAVLLKAYPIIFFVFADCVQTERSLRQNKVANLWLWAQKVALFPNRQI